MIMLQASRAQPTSWDFIEADTRRRRIGRLRKLAQEFRRIAEEYASLDRQLAERLREVIRELEEEAAILERDERAN
jgi:hypothetical protein